MSTEALYSDIREALAPPESQEAKSYQWAQEDTQPLRPWDTSVPAEDRPLDLGFSPDAFQHRAILRIRAHQDVFVAAHTGAGKTVPAEWAIAQSLDRGRKAIYTSPIKALSNQKFRDFLVRFNKLELTESWNDPYQDDPYADDFYDDDFYDGYGSSHPIYQFQGSSSAQDDEKPDRVGIITGDVQVNQSAPCLVVTTEILRSMIYDRDPVLEELDWVVFDEIHYMNDPERGRVWEEVITLLPSHIRMIFLSATTPNALDFSEWVGRVKQRPVYITSTPKRPVPLEHYLHSGTTNNELSAYLKTEEEMRSDYIDTLDTSSLSPAELQETLEAAAKKRFPKRRPKDDISQELTTQDGTHLVATSDGPFHDEAIRETTAICNSRRDKKGGSYMRSALSQQQSRHYWIQLFRLLHLKQKFPVVVFVFSKKMCVRLTENLQTETYTSRRERSQIRVFIDDCLFRLEERDRELPQIRFVTELLMRGIAVHHGGLLPLLKEMTEILFARGFIRILFATETFAMGINMPTRTVVFSNVNKHDGTDFRTLLPGEYTQMSGRAGRRGLDSSGTVLVLHWKNTPTDYKQLISGKPLPLVSRFHLTYQTILSIACQNSMETEVTGLLRNSFSEFRNGRDTHQAFRLAHLAKRATRELQAQAQTHTDDETRGLEIWRAVRYLERKAPQAIDDLYRLGHFRPGVPLLVSPEADLYPLPVWVTEVHESHLMATTQQGELSAAIRIEYDWVLYLAADINLEKSSPENAQTRVTPLPKRRLPFELVLLLEDLHEKVLVATRDPCPTFTPETAKKLRRYIWLEEKQAIMERQASEETLDLFPDYHARLAVLKELHYMDEEEVLSLKGRIATRVNTCHELLLTEFLMENGLEELSDAQCAALLSCLVSTEAGTKTQGLLTEASFADISKVDGYLHDQLGKLFGILTQIEAAQQRHGMDFNPEKWRKQYFAPGLVEVVYYWASGHEFREIMKYTEVMEGTVVRSIMRLDELCQEIGRATAVIGDPTLAERMERISAALRRDIVFCGSLYVENF